MTAEFLVVFYEASNAGDRFIGAVRCHNKETATKITTWLNRDRSRTVAAAFFHDPPPETPHADRSRPLPTAT